MKVKRMVKRLFAVGAGATMLGATVMGAMAANLGDYPDMFVTGGAFNGFFVVGEAAASVDNLAMTDIATGMKTVGGTASTAVSVEGDSWLAQSGTDELEIGESIGPAADGVVDFLDNDDLDALADGELKNSKGTFEYEQFLHFDNAVINVTYDEDDEDVTDLFVKIADNAMFARYQLDFIEAAESDIDQSESFELKDFEGKEITMMGRTFDIVQAVTGGAHSNRVKLTLMAGAVQDTLQEGESRTYTVGGKDYEVELTFTDINLRGKFVINGETTNLLEEGETYTLVDNTVLGVSEILYQDYAGGIHSAEFFLGADKLVLEDDDIEVGSSTDELKVNEETIDGADVVISGDVTTNATAAADGALEIDDISVNMTAQDDLFVAAGETLSGQPEFEEKELLFTQNWDLRFEGLSDEPTNVISVKDTNGEKEYELTFTNVNGNVIKMPFVYATGGAAMRLGDQDDVLNLVNGNIADDEYFILNDDTDEDSVTHVVQYKGAKVSTDQTKLKFNILATGETVERNYDTTANTATLKLSGTTFSVANTTLASTDDFGISVTGGSTTGVSAGDERTNYLIAKGGAKIFIKDENVSSTAGGIDFNISLIDGDRIDDVSSVPYLIYANNVTAAAQEVDLGSSSGITLRSPEDNDDNNQGYANNGAWVVETSPSGSGTSADTLTIDWPENERVPMVYVTSGATATSKKSTGGLVPVTVVDATRLDSEVASTDAQNLVVVGGPCVNTVAAELMGNPANCAEGFTPGKAMVKLWEHTNGNVAMLVAGYSGADTRLAGKVLANTPEKVTAVGGREAVIEGTTSSDAMVAAPSAAPAPVAPAAPAAPVVE